MTLAAAFGTQFVRLVGREVPLATMREVTRRDGLQILCVSGDAGIGKTRLVQDFLLEAAGAQILTARCTPLTRTQPFAVLRSFAPIEDAPWKEQIHVAVRCALLEIARERRLILVLDDIQWIDAASRDLLAYFVQSIPEEPVLLVLLTRERDGLVQATASTGRLTEIALEPLDDEKAHELLRERVPAEERRQQIVARAAGNPLHLETLVGIERDELPSTLRGAVLAHFDALEPQRRRALQKAAVFGESEAFRHALIEEAVYSTLARRDRQALHRQAAAALEEGEPAPELLAHHWSESAEPERAVPYLLAAAEHAARKHANEIVVEHCRKLLAILTGDDERTLRAQLLLGRALKLLGRFPEADAALTTASRALYARLGGEDTSPALLALYIEGLRELGDAKARAGALDEAFARLEEAHLALASFGVVAGTHGLRESLLERMAWVRFRQGRLDEALRRADDLVREVEAQPDADPLLLASLYDVLASVLAQFGKLDAAVDAMRKGVALHHERGFLSGKADAQTKLGLLQVAQGKWHEAADCFERSERIRREIGSMTMRVANLQSLARLRLAMGQHAQASEALETSLRIARQLGHERDTAHALMGLAHVAVSEGRFADANALLAQLEALDRSLGDDDRLQIQWLSALVEADRSIGHAIDMAEEGCRIAHECGLPASESDCARILGTLYTRAGNASAAAAALRQSLEVARKAGDSYRGALAMLELGALAPRLRIGRREGQAMVEEAARVFVRLGAAHDARRATALLRALQSAKA